MEPELQWLSNCLTASLDNDPQVRSAAVASLNQASLHPGFGSALCRIAANREISMGLRQSAAILLKHFIKKHWQEDEEAFEHPVVSNDEKATMRKTLLSAVDDPQKKICTALSACVATIAHYDWPDQWPDILPFLVEMISNQNNMNAVHGGLRCLALLSADLDDKTVPYLLQVLFPPLHAIVSASQVYDQSARTKALSVVYSCVSMLGAMSGVYKPWMDQFSSILRDPVPSEDPDDWSLRMEVLKCLNQFLQNFPILMDTYFIVILGPLWQTFASSLGVYQRASVEGAEDPYSGRYDSDGSEASLESFIIQLFEVLLTIMGSQKYVKVVADNVKELVYYTIAFMQMTEEQVHAWSLDANQFISDEDENTYSCRVSGAHLMEEVISAFGARGIDAVLDSAKRRFSESQHQKAGGASNWWRIREATLYALASVSDQMLEFEASGHPDCSLGNVLDPILTEDMDMNVHEYPFLYARMFASVAKFSSVINNSVVDYYLLAAIRTVGMNVPPPVKVGACRALSQLLAASKFEQLQPHMLGFFQSLADLLNHASDETLHLALETLKAAAIAGHDALASIEPVLSPIMLNMWASHVSDPFISIDALEVLEEIKKAPGCIHPLVSRVLPFASPILNKAQQQPDCLVAGTLDLVTMLSKNAPGDVVKAIFEVTFDPIIQIVLQSDDHSDIQNATQCLASLIAGGKEQVLQWSVDPGFTVKSLLDVASRLLDPSLESSASLFIGTYVSQLLIHLPSQMAPHIRDLVVALVGRMQSCEIAGLRSSLLLSFARLVHTSVPKVEQFIDLMVSIPAEGYSNSFSYIMPEWTKQQGHWFVYPWEWRRQLFAFCFLVFLVVGYWYSVLSGSSTGEISGAYQIKITTTALALLLSTGHVELGKINVQGHLVKSSAGITTRSKAKLAPDRWTSMPLPGKMLAILADTLSEIQEQVDNEEEDSDWEDAENDDVGINQELLNSATALSHSRPTYEYLDAMANAFNEDQEGSGDDDLLCSSDPLNEINLANYLVNFLVTFSQSDMASFDSLVLQHLTTAQRSAIKKVLKG